MTSIMLNSLIWTDQGQIPGFLTLIEWLFSVWSYHFFQSYDAEGLLRKCLCNVSPSCRTDFHPSFFSKFPISEMTYQRQVNHRTQTIIQRPLSQSGDHIFHHTFVVHAWYFECHYYLTHVHNICAIFPFVWLKNVALLCRKSSHGTSPQCSILDKDFFQSLRFNQPTIDPHADTWPTVLFESVSPFKGRHPNHLPTHAVIESENKETYGLPHKLLAPVHRIAPF